MNAPPKDPTESASGPEASSFRDLVATSLATCGVGYLPLAPGTWGSLVGVAIYYAVYVLEYNLGISFLHRGWNGDRIGAWLPSVNLVLLVALFLAGVWASGRAAKIWGEDDPQRAVIDEVAGQLVVFLFIPFTTAWWLLASGFVLFRFFDIVKPFPVNQLQDLHGGLGICADDIAAGIYAGVILSIIHSIGLTF